MNEILLYDSNFYGDECSSQYSVPTYFRWTRSPRNEHKVAVLTDQCLPLARTLKDMFKVAWILEPRAINPYPYEFVKENPELFDVVITHDKELLSSHPREAYWATQCGTWIAEKDRNPTQIPSSLLSIVASSKNFTTGHQLRHKIITLCGNNIDGVYGNGYNKIENKAEALVDFAFSIAIENSKTDIYFTEKIIDCFLTNTVPVYWGTDDIGRHFNERGIVFLNSVDDQDIIETVEDLSFELYEDMKDAIEENFILAQDYLSCEDIMWRNFFHEFKESKI